MGVFDSIKEMVTQKPVGLKKPDFYKADSDSKKQLERLQQLYATAPDRVKPQIERDMKLLAYGIAGEENVAFELNNSYLPIIVLHNLRLEHEGLSVQIDYLIITTKFCLVVECKNLFGNLEVNSRGEFIRELEFNGKRKKEGIYSPITQNTRHMEMIKQLRLENKKNTLMRVALEKSFGDFHKSVIVLANPKTVIDLKRAPKNVKDQIIRSDQLIDYIKRLIRENKDLVSSEKEMYEMADFFVGLHKENPVDYTERCVLKRSKHCRIGSKSISPKRRFTKRSSSTVTKPAKRKASRRFMSIIISSWRRLLRQCPRTWMSSGRFPGLGMLSARSMGKGLLR